MIPVSTDFQIAVADYAGWLVKAQLIFASGERMNLTGADFCQNSLSFDQATSSHGSFNVGAAITGAFSCTLENSDHRFDEYDFTGSRIVVSLGMAFPDGSEEWIRKGTFWIDQPASYGETISLSSVDSLSQLDIPYTDVATVYPTNALTVVIDICQKCGVGLANPQFSGSNTLFKRRPDNCTCRDVLSYVCQATGNYARMGTDDRLLIEWYDMSAFDTEDWLDGGSFDGADTPYPDGDTADGGNFDDYSSGADVDGGSFDSLNVVTIGAFTSATICTDDVVITGICVTASDEVKADGTKGAKGETVLIGPKGYVLDISDNPLISYGEARETAQRIATRTIGLRFRPFDTSCIGDPSIEAGDPCILTDRRQNSYRSYLTSVRYKVDSFASLSCSAETPLRNSAASGGAATRALKELAEDIRAEQTAREIAVRQFNDDLANSPGVYTTKKVESGATTLYVHDKKALTDSTFVWKTNAAGFGMSVDGGKTYAYGLDKMGNAILNTIYAVGIDASYIDTGALRVKNKRTGKTIFCADVKGEQFWWDTDKTKLDQTGFLKITGGEIGGFTVTSDSISNGAMSLRNDGLNIGSLMTLNNKGIRFKSSNGSIGSIGTTTFLYHPNRRGITFNLSHDDGWYMAWTCQRGPGAQEYDHVILYSNFYDDFYTKGQLHLMCDFDMHGYTLRNAKFDSSCRYQGGVDGEGSFYFVTGYKSGSENRTLQLWHLTVTFSHGFVTGWKTTKIN